MFDDDYTEAENDICYLDELIIEGITVDGSKFRPSDWVDRICGMLAGFARQKVIYSNYLRPLVYKNVNCVAVKKQLESDSPDMFEFIMQFARDNQLLVVDCAKFRQLVKKDPA